MQPINAGLPQGSVLDMILFDLFVPDCETCMFPDNTTILTKHEDVKTAVQKMRKNLNKMDAWTIRKLKIKLNGTKRNTNIFALKNTNFSKQH